MNSREETELKKETVPPLIKIVEEPKTQTQTKRQKRISKLETAIDAEDSTTVEVCFQDRFLNRNLTGPRLEGVVVYIRPTTEKTQELYGARELATYRFDGKSVIDVRNLLVSELCDLRQRAREQPTESSWLYLFSENTRNEEIYEKIIKSIGEIK